MFLRQWWWKGLAIIFLLYTIVAGFLSRVPRLPILHESIRNLYFHVPMWFGMILLLLVSTLFSILYLMSGKHLRDTISVEFARTGLLFGIMGLLTGMQWANFTWGSFWVNDPKLNGAAIGLLIYVAYFILRGSIEDGQKRAKVAAVYSIFAFVLLNVFILVIPRLTDSLHPGNGGNPGFNQYDLDNHMRMVFYPAVIGWALLGVWITSISIRISIINEHLRS